MGNKLSGLADDDRQVIPRWRSFNYTTMCGQLRSIEKRVDIPDVDNEIQSRLDDWNQNKDIVHAVDFLNAAFVSNKKDEINNAVVFIKENHGDSGLIGKIIERVECKDERRVDNGDVVYSEENKILFNEISHLKKRLITYPKDPIGWADLSYYYTRLGIKKKAIRTIRVALNLAPNNRFVLRSAARLFIHLDDPIQAHDILKVSDVVKVDPWILSAEIAVAHAAKRTSRYIKKGSKYINDGNVSPWHISELACAIGTIEFNAGKHKKTKKFLNMGLIAPTENSIAQVGWVSRRDSLIILPEEKLSIPNTFEARAWHSYQNECWKDVIKHAESWFADQPFSSRPAILGSYVSAMLLDDYVKSEEFCRKGLICNSGNNVLLNNLAFAYAYQNKIGDAEKILEKIDSNILDDSERVVCTATRGLIHFRRNNPEKGRECYYESIKMARKMNNNRLLVLAVCYYILEEINFEKNIAIELFEVLDKKKKGELDKGVNAFVGKVKERVVGAQASDFIDMNLKGMISDTKKLIK